MQKVSTPQKSASAGTTNYNEVPKNIRMRPYLIIAPGMIILIGIMIPFLMAIFLSLTNYSFKNASWHFVWFKNWLNMLKDAEFYHSLLVTFEYGIAATGAQMILGSIIALLLKKDTWFSKILKVLFTFPLMVAPAIAVLIWQLMTSNSVGVLEKFLNMLGIVGFPWRLPPRRQCLRQ
jgi:multiple sugar transport system permease protein